MFIAWMFGKNKDLFSQKNQISMPSGKMGFFLGGGGRGADKSS